MLYQFDTMELNQEKNLVDYFTERPRKELYVIYVVGDLKPEESYISEIGRRLSSKLNMTEGSGRQLIDRKLDKMISQGLVEVEKNGKKFVELTERGNQIFDIIEPLFGDNQREKVKEALMEVMRKESRGNKLYETLPENPEKMESIVWGKLKSDMNRQEFEKFYHGVWNECRKKVEGEKWEKRNENREKLLGSDS